MLKPTDLGLSYEAALHGVQSAIAFKMENGLGDATSPKHMRVGIDGSKSDHAALARILMDKGIFTIDEYLEALRLEINQELHRFEEEIRGYTCNNKISFR